MAESVDAHGSGPCGGNFMGVRIPSPAPQQSTIPFHVQIIYAVAITAKFFLKKCYQNTLGKKIFPEYKISQ